MTGTQRRVAAVMVAAIGTIMITVWMLAVYA